MEAKQTRKIKRATNAIEKAEILCFIAQKKLQSCTLSETSKRMIVI